MLVLTRKQQQQIQVGEGVTITVLRIKGGSVRIGIEAPSDVRIVRSELSPHEGADETPAEVAAEVPAPAEKAESVEEEGPGYRVVSFRVPGQADERADDVPAENGPASRVQSMRDFMALRSAHSLD